MNNLEEPQYTRPEEVYGMNVPEVLLAGNKKEIQARKEAQTKNLVTAK